MTFFSGSPQETESQFLLVVKIRPKDLYGVDDFWTFTFSGTFADMYAQSLNAELHRFGKISRIESKDNRYDALIYGHESGPEIFLIPAAFFLSDAVTSGIVGNFAYDLLKKIYSVSITAARKQLIEYSTRYSSRLQEASTSADEEITISDLEVAEKLEIIIRTPDGSIKASFDPEKGIDPQIIRLVTKRLKSYQKK